MARWFRSEPMEYISLIVNEDAAHDCLADLGRLGVIQFTDVSRFKLYSCLIDVGRMLSSAKLLRAVETKLTEDEFVPHGDFSDGRWLPLHCLCRSKLPSY